MGHTIRRSMRKILNEPENIQILRDELFSNPSHTMRSLSIFACEKFSFVDDNGKLKIAGCNTILRKHGAVLEVFAGKLSSGNYTYTPMARLNQEIPLPDEIPEKCDSSMKKNMEFVLIGKNDAGLRKVWNELIATEHPLGESRLVGCQLKYLIKYNGEYIGAYSFSSSALNLEARDKWIGWSKSEQYEHQVKVLNMSRFLIRKGVACKNLASYILSEALKYIKVDFRERYNISPWLAETFVDTENYSGTCYKAANWELLGQTKGRGRNDRHTKKDKSIKDIYIYVLDPELLYSFIASRHKVENYIPLDIETGLSASEWSEQEFGGLELGDERLSNRLVTIADDKGLNPAAPYPEAANGSGDAIQGYYKFLKNKNEEISFGKLISRHTENTARRINSSTRVLAIQDTSDLNYSGLKKTTGLGKIGKNKSSSGTLGLSLHSTYAVTERGIPLGVLHAECSSPEIHKKTERQHRDIPIEEKESYRWIVHYEKTLEVARRSPDTQIISVMDREADFFELLSLASENTEKNPVVIRIRYDRILKKGKVKLFEAIEKFPVSLKTEITVPPQREKAATGKKPGRPYMPARKATLEISYGKITMPAPRKGLLSKYSSIKLSVVYARERNPPEGAEPVQWRLFTTLDISSDEEALECVAFYRQRWKIEDFHRVLKSGCNVEKHKQGTAESLKRVIAIDMVIAWRIMLLTILGRECPEMPADLIFTEDELLVMTLIAQKKRRM